MRLSKAYKLYDKSSRKDKYTMEIETQCLQQGWQCPICKRIYSPTTSMCFYCGNQETITITDNVEPDVKARMVKDVAGSDAKIKILRDAYGNEYESD